MQKQETCISVFKDGPITAERYTRKWAELIGQLERSRQLAPPPISEAEPR